MKNENNKNITCYDRKDDFERECLPLLKELILKCGMLNIPCFFNACVESTPEKSVYVNDGIMTGSRYITLKEDMIEKHMCICVGMDTAVPREEIRLNVQNIPDEIDFGDDIDDEIGNIMLSDKE